jgi:calcineurin-like phosphoesterase family protein
MNLKSINPIEFRFYMTIFFTADQHFGHKNIIKFNNRPFSTIEEMDAELINRWNFVVKKKDIVYVLGDFAFQKPEEYLSKLNGNIIRIKGSHDHDIKEPYLIRLKPEGLLDEYGNQRIIILCHYSMRTWECSHYASWGLYGHSHNNLPPYGLSFDCGVDAWNYYPISLNQVAEKMATLKPIIDYRK